MSKLRELLATMPVGDRMACESVLKSIATSHSVGNAMEREYLNRIIGGLIPRDTTTLMRDKTLTQCIDTCVGWQFEAIERFTGYSMLVLIRAGQEDEAAIRARFTAFFLLAEGLTEFTTPSPAVKQ